MDDDTPKNLNARRVSQPLPPTPALNNPPKPPPNTLENRLSSVIPIMEQNESDDGDNGWGDDSD